MRDPSPYAGQTVRLRADAAELGGQAVAVADWYDRVAKRTWRVALSLGDPRAQGYHIRRGLGRLPDDDEVLLGRVDGVMQIVHRTEIEGETDARPEALPPAFADPRAVGKPCPACQVKLAKTDRVRSIKLGPGANAQARALARSGKPYEAVHIEVHWSCATGQEV